MIIFLYGEDDFRAKKKLAELKDKFLREVDHSGGSIEFLDGKIADLKQINEKAATASLLASRRMIVIEEIFSNKNKDLLLEVAEYFQAKEKNGTPSVRNYCRYPRENWNISEIRKNNIIFSSTQPKEEF